MGKVPPAWRRIPPPRRPVRPKDGKFPRKETPMRIHRSRLLGAAIILVAAIGATAVGSVASADTGGNTKKMLNVTLSGYAENPLALSTGASGQFQARIDDDQQTITYSLTYSGLTGTVTQAHIHFGSPSQIGGVSFFLCTNLGN